MRQLQGKNVIVTGGSRGLGTYIARAFAAKGAHVAVVARNVAALQQVASELRTQGVRAVGIAADLGDVSGYPTLLDRVERELGPVDILVNNAALEANSAFADFAPERIEELLRVDLIAPMLLTRALLPRLLARGSGHIVNIASLAGKSATAYNVSYAAAKGGLVLFSQSLRAELHKTGVSAAVICPGVISDGGMYAEKRALTGKPTPKLAGESSPARVAASVIKAIVSDRAELIVSPGPIRSLLALNQFFPDLMGYMARASGVSGVFEAVVAAEKQAARRQPTQSQESPPPQA